MIQGERSEQNPVSCVAAVPSVFHSCEKLREALGESTGRTFKAKGAAESVIWPTGARPVVVMVTALCGCNIPQSSLLQCSCQCCHGYSVIMFPSSLMLSWLLLDVWAGFPLWLDIIMELSFRVAPTLLGNEMLCGRGLTTVELCGLLPGESLLRLVLLLLVTRWELKGVRQSFSRMRSPSSSSSSLSPSAMLLL